MPDKQPEEEEFAFIKEKIKKRPLNKKSLGIHSALVLCYGILFGLAACFTFIVATPYMDRLIHGKTVVEIPEDRSEKDNAEDEKERAKKEKEAPKEQEAKAQEEEGNAQEEIAQTVVEKELEIEDFQGLQNKIYDVGKEASRSIVTVTGLSSVTDWFDTSYESKSQASGLIIAKTSRELLILTDKNVITDVHDIRVTFEDQESVKAQLKKYDGNTGLAILKVSLSDLEETTESEIRPAVLGNSLGCMQGQMVVAIGSPLGSNFSILTGNITSVTNTVSTLDWTYHIFTTDIVGSSTGSGVLLNLKGEVVGLVMQQYRNSDEAGTLTAVSISELKGMIEKLSNGEEAGYLGMKVSTVTKAIARDYELPQGVYVKDVAEESPAMNAGIQCGDVIVKMDDKEIRTIGEYESILREKQPSDVITMTVSRLGSDGDTDIDCAVTVGILQ